MKIDLQKFAEAVQGKKIVYLYRILENAAAKDGAALAFTTENSRTKNQCQAAQDEAQRQKVY